MLYLKSLVISEIVLLTGSTLNGKRVGVINTRKPLRESSFFIPRFELVVLFRHVKKVPNHHKCNKDF